LAFTFEQWQDTDIVVLRASPDSAYDQDEVLEALRTACARRPSSNIILDITRLLHVPTADEARELAEHIVRLSAPGHCVIAVVARLGAQYGVARMVESLSGVRDVTARAFTAVDEAAAWMLTGTPA
jgi:hypothetical protein